MTGQIRDVEAARAEIRRRMGLPLPENVIERIRGGLVEILSAGSAAVAGSEAIALAQSTESIIRGYLLEGIDVADINQVEMEFTAAGFNDYIEAAVQQVLAGKDAMIRQILARQRR